MPGWPSAMATKWPWCLKSSRPRLPTISACFSLFVRSMPLSRNRGMRGVAEIFGHGFAGPYPYLAMEYFPRGSLKDAVQTALSPRQAMAVLAQLAGALAQIHANRIVHRDLKPANVLVRDDGTMAIADFGVAARLEAVGADAKKQEVFGSPHYFAPELIRGEPASRLTDIYSLGIVFHEMLTGAKPFLAANIRELAQKHISAPVPRFDATLTDYQALQDGMLAKDAAARFQSANELLAGVDEVWTMLAVRAAQSR
ncbi:MAG: serine/threonine protein kinase [Betaproteobacteria bacterium]|nr:serine/threonine protein kinase [Betaproteobacteria bacterium]